MAPPMIGPSGDERRGGVGGAPYGGNPGGG
jgi:hypothetical protein